MNTFILSIEALNLVMAVLSLFTVGLAAAAIAMLSDNMLYERMLLEWAESSLYYDETQQDVVLHMETIPAISFRNNFAA